MISPQATQPAAGGGGRAVGKGFAARPSGCRSDYAPVNGALVHGGYSHAGASCGPGFPLRAVFPAPLTPPQGRDRRGRLYRGAGANPAPASTFQSRPDACAAARDVTDNARASRAAGDSFYRDGSKPRDFEGANGLPDAGTQRVRPIPASFYASGGTEGRARELGVPTHGNGPVVIKQMVLKAGYTSNPGDVPDWRRCRVPGAIAYGTSRYQARPARASFYRGGGTAQPGQDMPKRPDVAGLPDGCPKVENRKVPRGTNSAVKATGAELYGRSTAASASFEERA